MALTAISSRFTWLVVLATACGGHSRGAPGGDGPDSVGGAGSGSGAMADAGSHDGGDKTAPDASTTEVIDDGDHPNDHPALPPNTSAFWWGGSHLGNWFVDAPAPNAYRRDALRADISPPRDESVWAFRLQDSGRERGVDLWAQLDHPLGRAVDLGAYGGIAFWARLSGATQRLVVGMNPGVSYFEAPGEVPSVELAVSSEWQRFELEFEQFGIDGHAIASFDFIVGEGGGDVDLWIDDLSLRCRSACAPGD